MRIFKVLGLRFLGIRARLLLLFVLAGLGGAFCLVPLLPSEVLANAYPRIALVVALGSVLAAWIGRGLVRPLEILHETLRQRLMGKQVMPTPDWGLDEVRDLSEILSRFLTHLDQKAGRTSNPGVASGVEVDRDMRALLRVAQQAAGSEGPSGAVRRLLLGIQEHLRLGHLSMLLLDEESGQLELSASAGLDPSLLAELERFGPRPVKFAVGIGIAGLAIANGRTKVAPRGHRDKDFARLGGEFEAEVRNLACVPLRCGGQVVGVLNAANLSRPGGFDLLAVEFLEEAARLLEGWIPGLLGQDHPEGVDSLSGTLRIDTWQGLFAKEIERHRRFPRGLAVTVLELAFPEGEPEGPERNQLLAEVGGILRREVRNLDLVGRDGERFFLCLPETDLLGAIHLSGRIKDAVDRSAVREFGRAPRFVALVGVASSPEVVEDPASLVASAEDALLESRRAGDFRMSCFQRKAA
jgi:diguanylate cyclase (GGDEF)-like protein